MGAEYYYFELLFICLLLIFHLTSVGPKIARLLREEAGDFVFPYWLCKTPNEMVHNTSLLQIRKMRLRLLHDLTKVKNLQASDRED